MPRSKTGREPTTPAIQNIPLRTDLGKQLREAFAPKANLALLETDYASLELRIFEQIQKDLKK